jgi:hypothetical protein
MTVFFHPHAKDRLKERGATEAEVITTVEKGEQFPAKLGRTGFRYNFPFNSRWRGEHYNTKQLEVYAVPEDKDWLVITIITRYY